MGGGKRRDLFDTYFSLLLYVRGGGWEFEGGAVEGVTLGRGKKRALSSFHLYYRLVGYDEGYQVADRTTF